MFQRVKVCWVAIWSRGTEIVIASSLLVLMVQTRIFARKWIFLLRLGLQPHGYCSQCFNNRFSAIVLVKSFRLLGPCLTSFIGQSPMLFSLSAELIWRIALALDTAQFSKTDCCVWWCTWQCNSVDVKQSFPLKSTARQWIAQRAL